MKHEGFKNETENIIISILIYENKLITIISVWSEQYLKKQCSWNTRKVYRDFWSRVYIKLLVPGVNLIYNDLIYKEQEKNEKRSITENCITFYKKNEKNY